MTSPANAKAAQVRSAPGSLDSNQDEGGDSDFDDSGDDGDYDDGGHSDNE